MRLKVVPRIVSTLLLVSILVLALGFQPIEALMPEGDLQLTATSKMPELESFFSLSRTLARFRWGLVDKHI